MMSQAPMNESQSTPFPQQSQSAPAREEGAKKLEKISFIVFLITLILTPLVFLPTLYAPLDMAKTTIIMFGVLISALLYFIASLQKKEIIIPRHKVLASSFAILISLVVSSLLSTNIVKSFFGQGFELGTVMFLTILFLASLITVYTTYKDRDRVLYMYGAIIIPFILLVLFHVIRMFAGADAFAFGLFGSLTSSLVGKWGDVGLYAGTVAVLSYCALIFIPLKKLFKTLLIVLAVISGLFVFLVNIPAIWISVIITVAALGIYQYSVAQGSFFKRIPVVSTLIVIVVVICMFQSSSISAFLSSKVGVTQSEVALPWQLTLDVASDTLKESPFFGAGANRFGNQYLKYKPEVVNPTIFWNVEFNTGFGLIPTFIVTQGLIGAIAWASFLGLLVFAGYRALRKTADGISRFFVGSSFFASVLLWSAALLYVPSHAILLLAFVMTGLFCAALIAEGHISPITVSVASGNRFGKFVSVISIVLIVVCAGGLLVNTKKILALGYFQGGINALNNPQGQDIARAEKNFKNALLWDQSDVYYQALSEVNILKITALAQQVQAQAQKGAAPDQATVAQIGALTEEAVQYTRSATAFDPTNYYNHVAEARISEVAMSLQVQDAYKATTDAYAKALMYNPKNPSLYLNLARIEASQEKFTEAQQYIGAALQLKQNYIEAIFLLSQIQVSQGNVKDAITSVEVASEINPTNPLIFFQLGLLQYNNKSYQAAADAFTKAVDLNTQYANARYFLGLSYARLGKAPNAIAQFEVLAESNPESEEVALILSNLKAGKSPFTDAQPPIDSKPEQRKSLPVKETSSKSTE